MVTLVRWQSCKKYYLLWYNFVFWKLFFCVFFLYYQTQPTFFILFFRLLLKTNTHIYIYYFCVAIPEMFNFEKKSGGNGVIYTLNFRFWFSNYFPTGTGFTTISSLERSCDNSIVSYDMMHLTSEAFHRVLLLWTSSLVWYTYCEWVYIFGLPNEKNLFIFIRIIMKLNFLNDDVIISTNCVRYDNQTVKKLQ